MPNAYVIDAVRTPIGAYRGALAGVRPDDLAAHTIAATVQRSGVDPPVQYTGAPQDGSRLDRLAGGALGASHAEERE